MPPRSHFPCQENEERHASSPFNVGIGLNIKEEQDRVACRVNRSRSLLFGPRARETNKGCKGVIRNMKRAECHGCTDLTLACLITCYIQKSGGVPSNTFPPKRAPRGGQLFKPPVYTCGHLSTSLRVCYECTRFCNRPPRIGDLMHFSYAPVRVCRGGVLKGPEYPVVSSPKYVL